MDSSRNASSTRPETLRLIFGPFELDEAEARLTRDGEPLHLAPKAFAVLCTLARQPHALVRKNDLLDAVWGHRFVSESVLKTTISELRGALADDAKDPRYIQTVSRQGYRFIGAPAAASVVESVAEPAIEAAPRPAESSTSTMIGRAAELARLRHAWSLARAGKRQLVWITGEAGIGKTTLTDHFVAELGEIHCAYGQCVEQHGAGEPYLPVLEALADLCRRDKELVPLIRAVAPTWLLQLPWLVSAREREALQRDLAASSQGRMLREMGELLDRYTQDKALLLVTSDLHWTDQATLQLMDHIARRRGAARLMWLANFRIAEIIAADHPLAALRHELRLHGLCEEIALDPFSTQEVATYVALRTPALAADEAFVRALQERTDGMPLFVADVVGDLLARSPAGTDAEASARARLISIPIPENLAGIVTQYISRLPAEQRALLEAASVCGVEFRPVTVAAALGLDVGAVEEACAELARQQQWLRELASPSRQEEAEPLYAFRHAIYRQVLYKQTGLFTRMELHRKIGFSLQRQRAAGRPVTAAELASHFELAQEPMAALLYYAEAAESALLRFSPAEAMDLAQRALALLPRAPEGIERTALEVTLSFLHGVTSTQLFGLCAIETVRAFQRGEALLDQVARHPLQGPLLHALGVVLCMRAEFDEALAVADRSEARAAATGDVVPLLVTCVIRGLAYYIGGQPGMARDFIEKGLALLETTTETPPHAASLVEPGVMMLGMLAVQLLLLGLIKQGRARMRAAHARAEQSGQPMARLMAIWWEALFELRIGNAERVARLADQLGALADDYTFAHGRPASRWFRGWAEVQCGEPRGGHRLIREGYEEITRPGDVLSFSEVLGYAAEALLRAGDWDGARRELDAAMHVAQVANERVYLVQLLLLEARLAQTRGETALARGWIGRAIAEARDQGSRWLELTALVARCERDDAAAEDMQALASVLEGMTEGLDTQLVARARALLSGTTSG